MSQNVRPPPPNAAPVYVTGLTPFCNRTNAVGSRQQATFVHLPNPDVISLEDMAVMVKFIAESVMLGTVGLLPAEPGL